MAAQEKTIVISDVHMSNGKAYSWFQHGDSKILADMLNSIAQSSVEAFSNVQELVLLGDLFDLWLYPVTEKPCTTEEIIEKNSPVKEALQRCVEKIPVYYMNGNHDMDVKKNDLRPFNSSGKQINYIDTEEYQKLHRDWHFEHGHMVDMFNAPDDSGDTIGGYPLGYFMTRLGTKAPPTTWQDIQSELAEKHDDLHRGSQPQALAIASSGAWMVKIIVDGLLTTSGVTATTPISFLEPHLNGKYTVNDIKQHYGTLYGRWYELYGPYRILDTMLASRHFVGLDWYATELLSTPNPPKVVVMGHTHRPVHKNVQGGEYDNDGCCCSRPRLSYVEVVGNSAAVKYWP